MWLGISNSYEGLSITERFGWNGIDYDLRPFPKAELDLDVLFQNIVYYPQEKVDACLADWRERILEELGDGDVVTMENCLREILEAITHTEKQPIETLVKTANEILRSMTSKQETENDV